MKAVLTIYNHDEETTQTITLKQFIKLFNSEQIDGTSFTIQSVIYHQIVHRSNDERQSKDNPRVGK